MSSVASSDLAAIGTNRRRRRWPIVLAVIGGLLLLLVLVVAHFLDPARLTALLLSRASQAMKLDLHTSGPGSFALRPEPRLVLPGLSAAIPGSSKPFFSAGRVEFAVPWSTLRGRSSDISSIVLIAPDLDMQAMEKWLVKRPPSTKPVKLPTLTHGFRIENGTLRGANWRLQQFNLSLPTLADGKPSNLTTSGTLMRGVVPSTFKLNLQSTLAGQGQGMRIDNARVDLNADGDLPSFKATGKMLASNGFKLDLAGTFQSMPALWTAFIDPSLAQPGNTPFAVSLNVTSPPPPGMLPLAPDAPVPQQQIRIGRFDLGDPARQPALHLDGTITRDSKLDIALNGSLSRWPAAWPALPEPLASESAPIRFNASYDGAPNLREP
ncbi:MAG: hypothetical protein ABIQ97_04365, partial [Lysobacteraceae bacterium]